MKRVIKHQKKMMNTMYIVFGTFALLLFMITRTNPSFANEGLIIDEALYKIAEQTILSDNVTEEDEPEASDELPESDEDVEEPELTPEEKTVEGDENSQDLENDEDVDDNELEENLDGEEVDNGEGKEKYEGEGEGKDEEDLGNVKIGDKEGKDNTSNEGEHEGDSEGEDVINGVGKSQDNTQEDEMVNVVNENLELEELIVKDKSLEIMDMPTDTTQWVEGEDFEPLEVKASDGQTVLFTIMDRNLGATEAGTGVNSYGYYYQWGNNYGFANQGTLTDTDTNLVDITGEGYGPGKYYKSSTFIKRTNSPYRWDTDDSNETYQQYGNLNLWGGEKVLNPEIDRQGPCPSGYHVPDILEWETAKKIWCTEKMGASVTCSNRSNFRDDLKLPFAGCRDHSDASVSNQGSYGYYWSSSSRPLHAEYSYYLYFGFSSYISTNSHIRTNGYSVRCFKDSQTTKTLTLSADNGEDDIVYNIRWWEPITNSYKIIPEKEGYKFMGWYNGNDKFEFSNLTSINSDSTYINENTVLTARWVKEDTTQWVEGEDFEPLEVKASDGQTVLFTIMDRNLGAIEAGTGVNSYGYYYQWGNNYGFANQGILTDKDTNLVDITGEGYGPGKYYKSSTFIKRTNSPYRWDIDNSNETYQQYGNLNLWGGEGDTASSRGSGTDEDRQGPCPSGYHVPDMLEWKAAREIWCTEKMGASATCSNGSNFRDDLKLPFAGYRDYYMVSVYDQGSYGYYWSSSPNSSIGSRSYYLYFGSSSINPQSTHDRADSDSVRCFKNFQTTKTLTLSANNGEDDVVYNIRWWEPITKSYKIIPENEGYKFIGWYNGDEEFNFSDSTYINENTVLTAKWEKYPWYTYDADGGKFADQSSQNVIKFSKLSTSSELSIGSCGYKKIEGATKMYLYLVNVVGCGTPTVYIYNYEKDNSTIGDDYIISGTQATLPSNIVIDGDTVGLVVTNYCGTKRTFNIIGESEYKTLGVVSQPTRDGYTFDGWYTIENEQEVDFDPEADNEIEDKTIYARWKINQYKIIFDTDGGNEINPIEKDYNSLLTGISLPTPTKECNEFSGWENIPETMPAHDITLKAIWNYTCSRSSGAGGRKSGTTTREIAIEPVVGNEHNSADEKENVEAPEVDETVSNDETSNQVISVKQEVSEDGTVEAIVETVKIRNTDIIATVRTEVNLSNSSSSSSSSTTHTKEQNDAYSFAKSNGITTTKSIETAKMDTELTRIEMAKMLSNYAINVLGIAPDVSKGAADFKDVTEDMDKKYDNAITKAYQLGIMGQNMNKFRPDNQVTRAEFSTALSRLLYHTSDGEYEGTRKYYIPHITKLYNQGIIKTAIPGLKELRGYVMIMLMRTVK